MGINRIHVVIISLLLTLLFGVILEKILILIGSVDSETDTLIMQNVFTGGILYAAAIAICVYGAPEKTYRELSCSNIAIWVLLGISLIMPLTTPVESMPIALSTIAGALIMHFSKIYLRKKLIVAS